MSDVYSFSLVANQILTKKKKKKLFVIDETDRGKSPTIDNVNISEVYKILIEKCWSLDPKLRPSFDEIINELKTNRDFITNGINEEEYRNYIDFIDNSPISFDKRKPKRQLDDILELIENKFKSNKIDQIERIYFGDEIDLNKFVIEESKEKNKDFELFKIKFSDEKIFYAQSYHKEINKFYKNEMINFIRKLNVISQIDHPAILNFVGFSPINFDYKPKPLIITEYCPYRLDNSWSLLQNGLIESFLNDFPSSDDTKKLIIVYGIASAMAYLHSHNILHRDLKPSNIYLDD